MMYERRKPAADITPDYEDEGIFSGDLVQLSVDLVPQTSRSSRQDLIVRGFIENGEAIEVIFPGRRTIQAQPIQALLNVKLAHARKIAEKHGEQLDVDSLRFRTRIEGAWRPCTRHDETANVKITKKQLLAARWILKDLNDKPVGFGEISVNK